MPPPIPQRQPVKPTPRPVSVTPVVTPPPRLASACDDCPEMVRLPGGTFTMGSPDNELGRDSDETQHRVTVGGFAIGKYEVTQAEWRAVMGDNPSRFNDCNRCPVERVSWHEVQTYVEKLNARTGRRYRLPTEEEWEYACRAGESQTYCGADSPDPIAWYIVNSGLKTHPVGQKRANRYGLYDMSGNVWEWISSCHKGDCARRVFRGGCWLDEPAGVRAADRSWLDPMIRDVFLGFRLAQD